MYFAVLLDFNQQKGKSFLSPICMICISFSNPASISSLFRSILHPVSCLNLIFLK